jgi:hypothetical protein
MQFLLRRATALACAFAIVSPSLAFADTIKVPEGTEFPMRLEEKLSSQTSTEGERFQITLVDDVKLPDGTVLKAGYRGIGEIVHVKKNGMLGKAGEINVRLVYLRVGEERIRLRASKGAEGRGNTTNQVVGVVFLGVFAAFIKGHSVDIPKGTPITAYADQDMVLTTPIPAPPPVEV